MSTSHSQKVGVGRNLSKLIGTWNAQKRSSLRCVERVKAGQPGRMQRAHRGHVDEFTVPSSAWLAPRAQTGVIGQQGLELRRQESPVPFIFERGLLGQLGLLFHIFFHYF